MDMPSKNASTTCIVGCDRGVHHHVQRGMALDGWSPGSAAYRTGNSAKCTGDSCSPAPGLSAS